MNRSRQHQFVFRNNGTQVIQNNFTPIKSIDLRANSKPKMRMQDYNMAAQKQAANRAALYKQAQSKAALQT